MKASVELRVLHALVAVGREGSVTRAAERLHLTQPAVSLQLKRLAQDTGVVLFRRTAGGLEPTRDGAILIAKAEQVLAAATDFGHTARHLSAQLRGKLRIGTVVDPEFTRLGAFLKALVKIGPGIEAELRQGMSGDVPARLKRGELDVGFYLGEVIDPDTVAAPTFLVRELVRFHYRVVAPPGLGQLVRGRGWADLAALPWIGTPPASVHHRLLSRIFADLGVRQNVVALVDQEASMLAMVRAGVGLSLCREAIALGQQQAHGLVIADCVTLETALSFLAPGERRCDHTVAAAFQAVARAWRLSEGIAQRS